jgi:GMP synthase (glutamine-hydrolysing)
VSVFEGETPPAPDGLAGVVVTGSSAMVSEREPWSEAAAAWLADAVASATPVLGICYGHQLLAHGLGGRVAQNPQGREIGSVEVSPLPAADGDALLGGDAFRAQTSHVEAVLELPPGATRLATTALDPNHAFRVGETAWGVQFHPEFDADIMRGYLAARRDAVVAEGLDPDGLVATVGPAPRATAVLRRFAAQLRG